MIKSYMPALREIKAACWDGTLAGILKIEELIPELKTDRLVGRDDQVKYWIVDGIQVNKGDFVGFDEIGKIIVQDKLSFESHYELL